LSVVVAENGLQVMERFKERGFDLILMDCKMPQMDGYEASRRIREMERYGAPSPIPIIALTAFAMEDDRDRCLEAGMDDCLCKPFRQKQLRTILSRWLPPASPGSRETDPFALSTGREAPISF
jgi:CheY-like chemotaxis protein